MGSITGASDNVLPIRHSYSVSSFTGVKKRPFTNFLTNPQHARRDQRPAGPKPSNDARLGQRNAKATMHCILTEYGVYAVVLALTKCQRCQRFGFCAYTV